MIQLRLPPMAAPLLFGAFWLSALVAAFSAVAAPPVESIAQRALVCAACHGAEGRATTSGYYPRIAGKPAGYLYNQLLNFRAHRRGNAEMSYLVERQRDDFLRELAHYFSSQEIPYAPPTPLEPGTQPMLERGRTLTETGDEARMLPSCASCHGARLTGAAPAIPGLIGLPYGYLVAQLGAWRQHSRQAQAPDCMSQIAMRLGEDDVTAVAAWLANQPAPANPHPEPTTPSTLPLRCGSIEETAR